MCYFEVNRVKKCFRMISGYFKTYGWPYI